ncbi:FadR/GntR family transcriptional regulator [Rhodococcus sp. NPDC003318]|uniref:FadR/GntR family transcriptional regulator n=1 Tax=Rhodococcus sp. NPDC003318 TaxID=3364503 RepID=UPI0036B4F890
MDFQFERPTPMHRVGTLMRAPKTAELIATNLRRQIVRGELKAGEILPPESNLMEQFGVSRPTLREAFRILEAESLIGVRRGAGGGARVLEPDPKVAARHVGLLLQLQGATLQDVYEARLVTEPACARLLARRRSKKDVEDLRAQVERFRKLGETGLEATPDRVIWSRASYRFHEMIMHRCGNKTLAVQAAVLADIIDAHLAQVISSDVTEQEFTRRCRRSLKSYTKLVDLVEARDADGAENHWRSHMENETQYLFSREQSVHSISLFT